MFEQAILRRDQSAKLTSARLHNLLGHYKSVRQLLALEKANKVGKSRNRVHAAKLIARHLHKRPRPEDTYEMWYDSSNVNVKGRKEDEDLAQLMNAEDDEDDDDDAQELEDKVIQFTNKFDTSNDTTKAKFLIHYHGLEVMPDKNQEGSSFMRHHLNNLQTLLHLNVLRKNWALAYKVFCLLVRIPQVDLRALWPIGVEILAHWDSNGTKEERFFRWLASFYSPRQGRISDKAIFATTPVWRCGTQTSAPIYEISYLWRLFEKGENEVLKDKLEELELVPPYSQDGVIHFLRILSLLKDSYESADKDVVIGNMNKIRQCMEKCDTLRFEYPKESILEQMKELEEGDIGRRSDSYSEETQIVPSQTQMDESNGNLERDENENDDIDDDWGEIEDNGIDGWGEIQEEEKNNEIDNGWGEIQDDNNNEIDDWGEIEDDKDNNEIDDGWGEIEDDEPIDNRYDQHTKSNQHADDWDNINNNESDEQGSDVKQGGVLQDLELDFDFD